MNRLVQYLSSLLFILMVLISREALASVDREQEVRDVATAFVTARTADMGWEVRIRRITIADALKLPDGIVDYEVLAPQQWEGWGNVAITIIARQKERVVRNISVKIEVDAQVDMVVALRQLERGVTIADTDLLLQRREITQNSHLAARKLEDVVGKKARSTLKANQPVRMDQIEKVPLIKSGQMVTIIAESGALKISVTGKARSSGAEGDIIRVQNISSLKEIPARVIDASTVQVGF